MPEFDATNADVFVYVRRESGTLLSSMGHDLKIRVEDFSIDVDFESGEVTAQIDAGSLRPVDAIKWESREETGELSDGDRHEIEQRMSREVLEADEYPEIEFHSASVQSTDDGWHVEGTLELHGEEHDVEFDVERRGERARIETSLDHTDYGIEPYSAMLGSLKVAPEVVIEVEVPLPDSN